MRALLCVFFLALLMFGCLGQGKQSGLAQAEAAHANGAPASEPGTPQKAESASILQSSPMAPNTPSSVSAPVSSDDINIIYSEGFHSSKGLEQLPTGCIATSTVYGKIAGAMCYRQGESYWLSLASSPWTAFMPIDDYAALYLALPDKILGKRLAGDNNVDSANQFLGSKTYSAYIFPRIFDAPKECGSGKSFDEECVADSLAKTCVSTDYSAMKAYWANSEIVKTPSFTDSRGRVWLKRSIGDMATKMKNGEIAFTIKGSTVLALVYYTLSPEVFTGQHSVFHKSLNAFNDGQVEGASATDDDSPPPDERSTRSGADDDTTAPTAPPQYVEVVW